MTQMPPSCLQLLGTFQLLYHAEVVNLGQARLEELVAFLALYPGKPFSRSQIAYQFWPDSNERQARTNARNLLYKLKQAWPDLDNAITGDHRLVMWRSDADVVVDVQTFKGLLGRAEASKAPDERVRWRRRLRHCATAGNSSKCIWSRSRRKRPPNLPN